MRRAQRARATLGPVFALALLGLGLGARAVAGPSDYVQTPIVEEGEREIDFKFGSARLRDGSRESKQSFGLGWGVNSGWFTEFYAVWHKKPGDRHSFDAWEWENKFQLTETGRYPVDVGVLLEIERPQDRSEGYEVRWGPLLQTEIGSTLQANLNLLLEKHLQAAQGGPAELGYQWQLKYRWRPALEWGAQGFGNVGPWRDWLPVSQQSHIAGPAVFGRVDLGQHKVVKYTAGLLFGLNHASPVNTLRVQTEFEF
ncbi:MAG: hypothetical protein ABIO45_01760 [Burkholderiaceae bacterium]